MTPLSRFLRSLAGAPGLLALLVLAASVDSSPWGRTLGGVAHAAGPPPTPLPDDLQHFLRDVLPVNYPKLVRYLRQHGPEKVTYVAQDHHQNEITFAVGPTGLTATSLALISNRLGGPITEVMTLQMIDTNRDGGLDRMRTIDAAKKVRDQEPPFVQGEDRLWYVQLLVAFQYGQCCR